MRATVLLAALILAGCSEGSVPTGSQSAVVGASPPEVQASSRVSGVFEGVTTAAYLPSIGIAATPNCAHFDGSEVGTVLDGNLTLNVPPSSPQQVLLEFAFWDDGEQVTHVWGIPPLSIRVPAGSPEDMHAYVHPSVGVVDAGAVVMLEYEIAWEFDRVGGGDVQPDAWSCSG